MRLLVRLAIFLPVAFLALAGNASAENPVVDSTPQDFWFSFSDTSFFLTRTYAVNGSPSDPMLWLYDSEGNLVAANDDYHGLQSHIELQLQAGMYRLRAGFCCGDPNAVRQGQRFEVGSSAIPLEPTTTTIYIPTTLEVTTTSSTTTTVEPTSTTAETTSTTAGSTTTEPPPSSSIPTDNSDPEPNTGSLLAPSTTISAPTSTEPPETSTTAITSTTVTNTSTTVEVSTTTTLASVTTASATTTSAAARTSAPERTTTTTGLPSTTSSLTLLSTTTELVPSTTTTSTTTPNTTNPQVVTSNAQPVRPASYTIEGGVEISGDLAEGVTPQQARVVVVATAATMVIPSPRRRVK